MHRSLALLAAALVAVLVVAPLSAAQPPAANIKLHISNLPPGPENWAAGTNNTISFQVLVTGEQTVCPPGTMLSITVSATTTAAGVTVTVNTPTLTVDVAGAHTNASKLSKSAEASVQAEVADDADDVENATLDVTASATAPQCVPPPAMSVGAGSMMVNVEGADEALPDGDDDDGDDNETDNGTGNGTKKKKSGGLPGVEAPLVLVTLVLAAVMATRRRRDE